MDIAATNVQLNARKVLWLQLILATLLAAVYGIIEGSLHAMSAFFGGMISVAVSLLLRRGVLKANEIAKDDPKKSMLVLYVGALQRFVLVLVMFVLGLGLFKLDALATVLGFGIAQIAYVVVMRVTAHPAKR